VVAVHGHEAGYGRCGGVAIQAGVAVIEAVGNCRCQSCLPCLCSVREGSWGEGVVVPEPGIPETAIRKRSDGGIDWNFAGLSGQLLPGWNLGSKSYPRSSRRVGSLGLPC
jgi:hypothetical protein